MLGYRAREVATILDTSEESVTSALKRARVIVQERLAPTADHERPPRPVSPEERALVDRLTRAYESGDIDTLVTLLTDDVAVTMPPMPLEYYGIEQAARFLAAVTFRDGRTYRLVETRANGQPAFGTYVRDPRGGRLHATEPRRRHAGRRSGERTHPLRRRRPGPLRPSAQPGRMMAVADFRLPRREQQHRQGEERSDRKAAVREHQRATAFPHRAVAIDDTRRRARRPGLDAEPREPVERAHDRDQAAPGRRIPRRS